MRLGIVVQRYGNEVNGGAELHARQIAEHLVRHMDVEVLTTCAQDYYTWRNVYRPGADSVNGIPVRRFVVERERDMAAFNSYSEKLLAGPHTYFDEVRWMEMQGPYCPGLFRHIEDEQGRYDLLLFFTYQYATTWVGLQLAARRAVMLATAHDDVWLRLGIYRPLFQLPRGFIYNSPEEQELIHRTFANQHIPGRVLGNGIDTARLGVVAHEAETSAAGRPAVVGNSPYIVYVGRVDPSKGCDQLVEFFLRYKAETGSPLKLVLVGGATMPLPQHPDIHPLGFLLEEPYPIMANARALVLPSRMESLSLVVLESLALGRPVLVNGQADVLRGHCERSNGGLYYYSYEEFAAYLTLLLERPELSKRMGSLGQEYVRGVYNWDVLEDRFVDWLEHLLARA